MLVTSRLLALVACYCLLLLGLGYPPACAQKADSWTRFETQVRGESRYGYRDASGRVRLPARFGPFTPARCFRHIMAANDYETGRLFYLLKNGREVGRDSVYMSGDYEVACESEGTILFRARKKDRVGFLDARGRVLISAVYNYATPFHNGLSVALVGAKRTCWEKGGDTLHCEHLSWQGGRYVLLNQRGEQVADLPKSLTATAALDLYSLRRNASAPDTATTVTLPAANGDRLTFTVYEKEFRQWFFGQFVPVVRSGSAKALGVQCFPEVTTAGQPFQGWSHGGRAAFVAKFQSLLRQRLAALQPSTPSLAIFNDGLNPYIHEGPTYE